MTETITKNDGDLSPPTSAVFTFSGLPTAVDSAGLTATFRVRGDFGGGTENLAIDVDGHSFGTWLNNITGDDTIDNPSDDIGNDYASIISGSSTVAQGTIAPLLADGELVFTFDYSSGVGDRSGMPLDLAEVTISYTTTSYLPEPSTWFGVLTGMGLLVAARRRRGRGRLA